MKNAGAFSQNHLNLGIKIYLNGTLTSNIVIETSQVATRHHTPTKTALPQALPNGDSRSVPAAYNTTA
jgi:hypothetical protein